MKRIHSYILVKISGWERERFINLCCKKGITLWNCQSDEESVTVRMTRKDFFKTRQIRRKKCHATVKIIKKRDVKYFLTRYRRNYSILTGFIIAFTLMFVQSRFVWDIEIDGNNVNTDSTVYKFLNEIGVEVGDKTSDIDTEMIEKRIKNELFGVTWVNVRLEGNVLKISMDESKADIIDVDDNKGQSIISLYDGTVESIITRSGTPLVKAGDEVHTGDVLVENKVTVPDDYEENIQEFSVDAEADIYIRTILSYDEELEAGYEDKIYTGKTMTTYGFDVGKYEINIGFPRRIKEYTKTVVNDNLRIGKKLSMPIDIRKTVLREYNTQECEYSRQEAEQYFVEKLGIFIKHLKENKVQINDYHVNIERSGDMYVFHADIEVVVPADSDLRKVKSSE